MLGAVAVGALDHRIVDRGPHDRRLEIVDHQPPRGTPPKYSKARRWQRSQVAIVEHHLSPVGDAGKGQDLVRRAAHDRAGLADDPGLVHSAHEAHLAVPCSRDLAGEEGTTLGGSRGEGEVMEDEYYLGWETPALG